MCSFQSLLLYLSLSDCLSIGDLAVVREAAWEARNEWYDIGLGLGVSADDLDEIKEDNLRNCKACFRDMLKVWLRRSQPSPSWKELVKVLRSPVIGYGELADRLQSRCV